MFFLFFNDTATTEIYTYGHTRSLHDALPIYEDRWGGEMEWDRAHRGKSDLYGESIYTTRWEVFGNYQLPVKDQVLFRFSTNGHRQNRSEEHTSELQSLMRISYAVFCLQTKTHYSVHTTTHRVTIINTA